MSGILTRIQKVLGEYFPSLLRRLQEGNDLYVAITGGIQSLEEGSLSWARLNQILHRSSEAGVSSRQLIDRCRAEGIPVQNSVSRLDPEVVPAIRAWFESQPAQHQQRQS